MSETPEQPTTKPSEHFRSGYCAIVGVPNAGKSTLLNALLETKLSIISAKPQTTRRRVLGIHSSDAEQIIFLDTPGIVRKPSNLLHEAMLEEVRRSFRDADVILVVADATEPVERALPADWGRYVKLAGSTPIVIAVSKMDRLSGQNAMLPILSAYESLGTFKALVPISALRRRNLPELLTVLRQFLPNTTPFYELDQLSDQNERFFVGELIREVIYRRYRDEIPYAAEVEVREFKEREEGKYFISADIWVERDSQRAILIGRRAEALKSLGTEARKHIERFLERGVFLELHVKVRRDWRNDKRRLSETGFGG